MEVINYPYMFLIYHEDNDDHRGMIYFDNTIPSQVPKSVVRLMNYGLRFSRENGLVDFAIYADDKGCRICFIDIKNKVFNYPIRYLGGYSIGFNILYDSLKESINNGVIGKEMERNVGLDLIPGTCVCETHRWLMKKVNDNIEEDNSMGMSINLDVKLFLDCFSSFRYLLRGHIEEHRKEYDKICIEVRLSILLANRFQRDNIWYNMPRDMVKIIFEEYMYMMGHIHSLVSH